MTCASCSGNGKQGGGYHAVYVESRKYSSSNKWDGDHCYHCGYYHKTGGNWKEFVVRCSFCRKVWTRTVLYIFCWSSFLYSSWQSTWNMCKCSKMPKLQWTAVTCIIYAHMEVLHHIIHVNIIKFVNLRNMR